MFGCAQTGAGQGRSLATRQHRAAAEFHDKRMDSAEKSPLG
jgi:hypothetical protein